MFECSVKNRKEGNRFTASRRASGERPGTNLLGERTLYRFDLYLRENRYLHSISNEEAALSVHRCATLPDPPSRLPGIAIFWLFLKSAAARPNSHSFRVQQSTLIRAAAVVVLFLKSPTTVWLRVFLSNFQKCGKFLPRVASVNLPFKRGEKWQRRAQLNSSSISTIPGLYAPPPFRH